MNFFKKIAGSESKNVEKTVGGYAIEELNNIKKSYTPSEEYTQSYKDFRVSSGNFTKGNIIELINNGLDVRATKKYKNPLIFYAKDKETMEIMEFFGANPKLSDYNLNNLIIGEMSCYFWDLYWNELKPLIINPSYRKDDPVLSNQDMWKFLLLKDKGIDIDKIKQGPTSSIEDVVYSIIDSHIQFGYSSKDLCLEFIDLVHPDFEKIIVYKKDDVQMELPARLYYFLRIFEWAKKNEYNKLLGRYEEIFGEFDFNQQLKDGSSLFFLSNLLRPDIEIKYIEYLLSKNANPNTLNNAGVSYVSWLMTNRKSKKKLIDLVSQADQNTETSVNVSSQAKQKSTKASNKTGLDLSSLTSTNQVASEYQKLNVQSDIGLASLKEAYAKVSEVRIDKIKSIFDTLMHFPASQLGDDDLGVLNTDEFVLDFGVNLGWFHVISFYLASVSEDEKDFFDLKKLIDNVLPLVTRSSNLRGENLYFCLRHLRRFHSLSDILKNEKHNPKYNKQLASVIQLLVKMNINPLVRNVFGLSFYDLINNDRGEYGASIKAIENSLFFKNDQRYPKNVVYNLPFDTKDTTGVSRKEVLELANLILDSKEQESVSFIRKASSIQYQFINVYYVSLLDIAVYVELPKVVKSLVELGADLNHISDSLDPEVLNVEKKVANDLSNKTPLMIAINTGNKEIINYLISKKADVRVVDHSGLTSALHFAIIQKDRETIDLLLENGATLKLDDFRVNFGSESVFYTTIMQSLYLGDEKVLSVLPFIESHINKLKITDRNGVNILALTQKSLVNTFGELSKKYSEYGIVYNFNVVEKIRAFLHTDELKEYDTKKYLINIEKPDETLIEKFLAFVREGKFSEASALVTQNDINLNLSDKPILHSLIDDVIKERTLDLAQFGRILELYTSLGFYIDSRDKNNNTPLLYVLMKNVFSFTENDAELTIKLANQLIDFGANVNAINNLVFAVYDAAKKISYQELAHDFILRIVRMGAESARIQQEEIGLFRYDNTKYGL